MAEESSSSSMIDPVKPFRILSLDGGGAKGFYTLGVLKEIEGRMGPPLSQHFELIFGTSTGAIIAALIALGREVDEIHELYKTHVPRIMKRWTSWGRSRALTALSKTIFETYTFEDVETNLGIVATRWSSERPLIFKSSIDQAHGRKGTFAPGFGVTIGDAIRASCSAYPYFKLHTVTTSTGDRIVAGDGGFCANNPTLYAIADATKALTVPIDSLRVISIGVGVYPTPKSIKRRFFNLFPGIRLLQKVLEINTQSADQLRAILFKNVATIRISETYQKPELACDLLESDLTKLNLLRQHGSQSFEQHESQIVDYLQAVQ